MVIGVGFGVTALCLILIMIGFSWRKGYIKGIMRREEGKYMFMSGLKIIIYFSFKLINNLSAAGAFYLNKNVLCI